MKNQVKIYRKFHILIDGKKGNLKKAPAGVLLKSIVYVSDPLVEIELKK